MNNQLQRFRSNDDIVETPENYILSRTVGYIKFIITMVLTISALWGVWLMRGMIPILGFIVFYGICLIVGIAVISACVVMIMYAFEKVTERKEYNPDTHGKWLVNKFGKRVALAPIKAATLKEAEMHAKPRNGKIKVPTLLELLEAQTIIPAMPQMLIGFEEMKNKAIVTPLEKIVDYTPTWGISDDLQSYPIYGRGRSGKTNTIIWIIINDIYRLVGLKEYKIVICDYHTGKSSGLSSMLEPFRRYVRFSLTSGDVIQTFREMKETLDIRMQEENKGTIFPEYRTYVDEWNGTLDKLSKKEREYVVYVCEYVCREGAGYNVFITLVVHELENRSIGSANLRRLFMGILCHAIDNTYTQYVSIPVAYQKAISSLGQGILFFKNARTSDVTKLHIPHCTPKGVQRAIALLNEYTSHITTIEEDGEVPTIAPVRPRLIEQVAYHKVVDKMPDLPMYSVQSVQSTDVTPLDKKNIPNDIRKQVLKDLLQEVAKGKDLSTIKRELDTANGGRELQSINAALDLLKQLDS